MSTKAVRDRRSPEQKDLDSISYDANLKKAGRAINEFLERFGGVSIPAMPQDIGDPEQFKNFIRKLQLP